MGWPVEGSLRENLGGAGEEGVGSCAGSEGGLLVVLWIESVMQSGYI
jgi:hypothetical protein